MPASATKTAPPIRITRSDATNTRVPPVGVGPAGGAFTKLSVTRGSSQGPATICCAGRERDDPVVVGVATVHDAGAAGLLVHEQVEVVADQLHVEERVVDGHRLGVVLFLPDDVPGLVLVLPRAQLGAGVGDRLGR